MPPFQKYDEYIEKLLLAQYEISEIIDHNLTKGEIREDFLKNIICNQFKQIQILKGLLINEETTTQSGQCDIIFAENSARVRSLGSHNLVDIVDCKMVLEVKSNATGYDLKDFNEKAGTIKNLSSVSKPLCGIFCYQINLEVKTVFKRFGFHFNKTLLAFEFLNSFNLIYPNIDFVISLHKVYDENQDHNVTKQFFIRWDENNRKYLLFQDYPVSKYFFSLLKSINSDD